MYKLLAIFLSVLLFLSFPLAAQADPMEQASSDELTTASERVEFTDGERMFITLAENTKWRWNANDSAGKWSVIHLDTIDGNNRFFRFDQLGDGWYGIKHVIEPGTDYFVDVDDKSKDPGAVLHLFETNDDKVKTDNHRQFGFYPAGTDANGNALYYIQNRNSGLWIGVANNKDGVIGKDSKIIQTSDEYRKKWIVTPSVVPLSGNEVQVLKGGDTKGYAEFFEQNTDSAITPAKELVANSTDLHTFVLGTDSKWIIRWNQRYQAYDVEYSAHREEGSKHVWDLKNEKGSEGTKLHIWERQSHNSNLNTSQLWRFIQQSDGSVKIQSASSGHYVAPVSNHNTDLELSKTGARYEISVFDGDTGKASNQTHFAYAENWMAKVPDAAYLSSVNMPGTHDTGTAAVFEDLVPQTSITRCQTHFFGSQLNIGTRAFDIRCNAPSGATSADEVKIIHGFKLAQCYNRDDSDLTLGDILGESERFLSQNPTEAVVVVIKADSGSDSGLARALGHYIRDNKDLFWTGEDIPSMGEARGKIVLMRRFDINTSDYDPASDGLTLACFGPDLTDWDSYDYSAQKRAIKILSTEEASVYVQDAYSEGGLAKIGFIDGTFDQTTGRTNSHPIPEKSWVFNFTSTAGLLSLEVPLDNARTINPHVFEDSSNYFNNQRLGMVMHNFIDMPLARQVYETNNDTSRFYETKAEFPEEFSLVYGDTLASAEASLNTAATQAEGSYRFDNPSYQPTWEDFETQKEFSVTFTPSDSRLKPVTDTMILGEFAKKPLQVSMDSLLMTYGTAVPSLTWSFDEDELVADDTLTDLGVLAQIEDPLYSTSGNLQAGEYALLGTSTSEKYEVSFVEGALTVNPLMLNVQWSDVSNLVYTGAPVQVDAELNNVLAQDDCTADVEGGNEIGPSWDNSIPPKVTVFEAEIVELKGVDRANYQLPSEGLTKQYLILRATPDPGDYHLPTSATLTYGQMLSTAELEAAYGEGTFTFVQKKDEGGSYEVIDPDTEMPSAGTSVYRIMFTPTDPFQQPVLGDVEVIVGKKPLTVSAQAAIKTYGEATLLDFDFDPTDLASGDDKDSLGITLTAENKGGDSGDDPESAAGIYTISGLSSSTDYEVTLEPSTLLIRRLALTPEWPAVTQFVYNGSPVDFGASISSSDLLFGDSCNVAVYNADAIDAGSYTAVAYKLDNSNYRLDLTSGQLAQGYTIEQAEPSVGFPSEASLVYGEALSEAVLSGHSGDGSFAYVDKDLKPEVADSGVSYDMTFTPTDGRNYKTATQGVAAIVDPRAITVSAERTYKTYGETAPALDYSVDEAQLVGPDTVDSLQLDLALTAGEGEQPEADAASYEITTVDPVRWGNQNYQVNYQSDWLVVDPFELLVAWSNTDDLVYTGKPVNVTATLQTVLFSDDCTPVVEGGNEIGPSWQGSASNTPTVYTAIVTDLVGADRFNYVMHADAQTEHDYLIKPVDQDTSDKEGKDKSLPGTADTQPVALVILLFVIAVSLLARRVPQR